MFKTTSDGVIDLRFSLMPYFEIIPKSILRKNYTETAGVKPEEGGDEVKSSWPLCLVHTARQATKAGSV
jgi:hypothetical protein